MPWTAPKTWVTDEVLTAVDFNTQFRDNLLWLYSAPGWMVRGRVTAAGGIANGSGFTVARSGTSIYTITFTTAFPTVPIVVATLGGGGSGDIVVDTLAVGSCRVITYAGGSTQNVEEAADFDFMAVHS